MAMQLLKEWPPKRIIPPEKRKRESLDSYLDEDRRKKPRADDCSEDTDSTAARIEAERNFLQSASALRNSSPTADNALPSPPLIHPDRLVLLDKKKSSVSHNSGKYPLSPHSRSPERLSEGELIDETPSQKDLDPAKPEQTHRRSSDAQKHLPLRIDTDKALSSLDPRGAGYRMSSQADKDGKSRHTASDHEQRKASVDSYRPASNPQSRRQSESMLPPPSAGARLPRSENSTPQTSSPIKRQHSLGTLATNPRMSLSEQSAGTLMVDKELDVSKLDTRQSQIPVPLRFGDFAQEIVAAAAINMRMEIVKDKGARLDKESRRQQKHGFSFESLNDRTYSDVNEVEKSKARLSSQLRSQLLNQEIIASKLDAEVFHAPTVHSDKSEISHSYNVAEELDDLRRSLEKAQKDIDRLDRKRLSDLKDFARRSDFDEYARKVNQRDDGSHFLKKEDVLGIEENLASHTQDLQTLEGKISDLAGVTGERHQEVQGSQKSNTKQFQELETNVNMVQTRLAETDKENANSIAELQTIHTSSKEAFESRVENMTSITKELGARIEELSSRKDIAEDSSHSPASMEDYSALRREVQSLRQDLEALPEEQKAEYNILADGIVQLEVGFKEVHEGFARLKDDLALQKSPSLPKHHLASPQAPTLTVSDNPDRAKIEKLETDFRALETQVVVQKKQFDNLTTEDVVHSMIHHTKQLYKEHPGHVQDKLHMVEGRLFQIDTYISQSLEPRLAQIHTAIAKSVNEVTALNAHIQVSNNNINQTSANADKIRQDLSDQIVTVKAEVTSQRHLLQDTKDKLDASLDDTNTRLNKFISDIERLYRDLHAITPNIERSKSLLADAPNPQDLSDNTVSTEDPEVRGQMRQSNSVESKAVTTAASTFVCTSSDDGTPFYIRPPDDESDASEVPITLKRKQPPINKVSDSEDSLDRRRTRKRIRGNVT